MYTRENSRPLVECRVRRLTRSGATSTPSDVESATRSGSLSMLSSSRPPFQRQGQSEVVEQVDENRLARANPAPPLELPIDPGERDRVVQRVMRPAGVDPEPQGEVLQLGAVAGEGAGERQGVVEREAV